VFLQIRSNATNPNTGDPVTKFICVGYYRIVKASYSTTKESSALLTLARDHQSDWTVGSEWEKENVESLEALDAIEGLRKLQGHRSRKSVISDGVSWRTQRG
jgi:hypothetical protein